MSRKRPGVREINTSLGLIDVTRRNEPIQKLPIGKPASTFKCYIQIKMSYPKMCPRCLGLNVVFACTGISSEIRTKLRDWAVWQAWGDRYSQEAFSSNDSKTL